MLALSWCVRVPGLQRVSAAQLAADIVLHAVDAVEEQQQQQQQQAAADHSRGHRDNGLSSNNADSIDGFGTLSGQKEGGVGEKEDDAEEEEEGGGGGGGGGRALLPAITIVDFCAGAGGPTPVIARVANAQRAHNRMTVTAAAAAPADDVGEGQRARPPSPSSLSPPSPLLFVLTDLHPHLGAWQQAAAAARPYVGYVPQSVDAANAPAKDKLARAIVMDGGHSLLRQQQQQKQQQQQQQPQQPRVIRLFCLAFHHFDDSLARKILLDAMKHGDSFV